MNIRVVPIIPKPTAGFFWDFERIVILELGTFLTAVPVRLGQLQRK